MCANYEAVDRRILWDDFQLRLELDWKTQAFPGSKTPIIRRDRESGETSAILAAFGLVPYWSKDTKIGRKTYNCRAETVGTKPSFKRSFRNAQFCLVPMQAFYEPNWETGKAVRHRISVRDRQSFAAAAIWETWRDRTSGVPLTSFSLLTMNADGHPVMGRFHGAEDEKRTIVIVSPDEYDAWLTANAELARVMIEPPAADLLHAVPAPLPPRKRPSHESVEDVS